MSIAFKQDIFNQYYGLANYEAQRTYLLGMIEKVGNGPVRASYRYTYIIMLI